jgi:hypothetical protein
MKKVSRGRLVPMRKHFDRRQNPRVEVMSELYGCVVALDLPVRVRDASRGGFSVESPCEFPVGSEHSFRFQTEDGQSTTVTLVCRHAKRLGGSDAGPVYSAGFAFLPQPSGNINRVLAVIAAAAGDGRVLAEPGDSDDDDRDVHRPAVSATAARSAGSRGRRR